MERHGVRLSIGGGGRKKIAALTPRDLYTDNIHGRKGEKGRPREARTERTEAKRMSPIGSCSNGLHHIYLYIYTHTHIDMRVNPIYMQIQINTYVGVWVYVCVFM